MELLLKLKNLTFREYPDQGAFVQYARRARCPEVRCRSERRTNAGIHGIIVTVGSSKGPVVTAGSPVERLKAAFSDLPALSA